MPLQQRPGAVDGVDRLAVGERRGGLTRAVGGLAANDAQLLSQGTAGLQRALQGAAQAFAARQLLAAAGGIEQRLQGVQAFAHLDVAFVQRAGRQSRRGVDVLQDGQGLVEHDLRLADGQAGASEVGQCQAHAQQVGLKQVHVRVMR